jgi:hypothetical protein
MAEINIERKQRSMMPWLLAGVLLLGLLWFLFARNSNDATVAGTTDSTYRDTATAAGTLAPADSSARARDTTGRTSPPR